MKRFDSSHPTREWVFSHKTNKNDPSVIASEKMVGGNSFKNLMLYRQTVALESIAASLKNIDVNGIVSINRT